MGKDEPTICVNYANENKKCLTGTKYGFVNLKKGV